MADLSLHVERSKTFEAAYLRRLEERTSRREVARTDIARQSEAAARARRDQDAQATRAAEGARRLDAEQRSRDAQLAIDLRRLERDRLDTAKRLAAEQAAIDLGRIAQNHEDALRAEDVRIAASAARTTAPAPDSRFAAALVADERAAEERAAASLAQRAGQGPIRGAIVDVLA